MAGDSSSGATPYSANGIVGLKVGEFIVTEHAQTRYVERTKRTTVNDLAECIQQAGVCWDYPVKDPAREYALQNKGLVLAVKIVKGMHLITTVLVRGKKHVAKSKNSNGRRF